MARIGRSFPSRAYSSHAPDIPVGDITGTGVLLADDAVIDGVGISSSSGTGALVSAVSILAGTGLSTSLGTGILQAASSFMAGVGLSLSTGTGILLSTLSTLVGLGGIGSVSYLIRNRLKRHDIIIIKHKKR